MRHGKKFNHLGRKKGHREAMLSNMANSLIEHKRIFTTVAKAKALRGYVEPLITKAKSDSTHNRRIVFSYLRNKQGVNELFSTVADKVGDRPGGYTRILKTHNRLGDNAEMCMMELVDFNELMLEAKAKEGKSKSSGKKRTRRGGAKKAATVAAAAEVVAEDVDVAEAPEAVEEVAEEVVETAAETVEETTEAVEATEEVVEAEVEETPEAEAAEEPAEEEAAPEVEEPVAEAEVEAEASEEATEEAESTEEEDASEEGEGQDEEEKKD